MNLAKLMHDTHVHTINEFQAHKDSGKLDAYCLKNGIDPEGFWAGIQFFGVTVHQANEEMLLHELLDE